ncbi:proteasome assembly chaperone 2 [Coccinella septempunctata]|uniref:proteasome assembly chaperone 2 n=1 Tax=Coccinella septempunctata TaxID=41139 RepID=UPI001D094303|nr:proteasome assembly chaperone 2 [Coccinella septempunctata]
MTLIDLRREVDLNGFTLIIPSVSVANVPQLAIDLLIMNYDFKKVGMIWHPALMPLVGADPFNENSEDISTACELFVNESLKIATLQHRTSFHYKMLAVFLQDLKADIMKHKITRVIVLASGFDHELHKIDKGKLFYIDSTGNDTILEQIGVKAQPAVDDKYSLPGGGFCIQTYEFLKSVAHCTILIRYVSEGVNTSDAISMISILSKYLPTLDELNPDNIKVPHSWGCIFGSPPPIGMF